MKYIVLAVLLSSTTALNAAQSNCVEGKEVNPLDILMWDAIYHNDSEKLKELFSTEPKPSAHAHDDYGNIPLIFATWNNQLDVIQQLITAGNAKVNQADKYGKTALMWAIGKDKNSKTAPEWLHNRKTIQFLIEAGSDINMHDEHGWTPLMIAVQNNRADIVEILLEKGAKLSLENDQGLTALMLAIDSGNKDISKILIAKSNGQIDKRDKHGRTPLMWAVALDKPDIVCILLTANANPNIKNKKDADKRAIDYATEKNQKEMAEIFLSCRRSSKVSSK